MEPGKHEGGIPIFIGETKFTLDNADVTGADLRGLLPVLDDYDLWLRSDGPGDDTRIEPGTSYNVKPGSHYYTSKSEVAPGE